MFRQLIYSINKMLFKFVRKRPTRSGKSSIVSRLSFTKGLVGTTSIGSHVKVGPTFFFVFKSVLMCLLLLLYQYLY